jgi:hypothetical protein
VNTAEPVAYSLELQGKAVELAPGHFWAELRSGGCNVLGELDALGGDAVCRQELRVGGDGSFTALGELTFDGESALTFRSDGRLAAGDHARRGTALGRLTGGLGGRLAGTTGYVVSSFLLWPGGDLSEDHLGVLFVAKETEP